MNCEFDRQEVTEPARPLPPCVMRRRPLTSDLTCTPEDRAKEGKEEGGEERNPSHPIPAEPTSISPLENPSHPAPAEPIPSYHTLGEPIHFSLRGT
ncbi:hypothetical protein Pmani_038881 [Petrolisthes manimaculis]|uniref:Uncharacterized protein n=1 Tax=Petrolisthes manimaculis TaxID=1843537 RepID=A0AAE1NDT2_9EUCA|nr:hypothetical protein Pmani_038881 [Petrolisthes manimaculis]